MWSVEGSKEWVDGRKGIWRRGREEVEKTHCYPCHTFIMYSSNSPQDMDLEPSSAGTHSHITVTYLSRTSQESPSSEGDDDLMDSPQRRAGYNYR